MTANHQTPLLGKAVINNIPKSLDLIQYGEHHKQNIGKIMC